MSEATRPAVPKWPFFLTDAILLGLAWFVYTQSRHPLDAFALACLCACVALGAIASILPFFLDYRLTLKLAESESLASAVAQIRNLEAIATQIGQATGHWQTAQDHAAATVNAAKEIGERMSTEAKAFAEFMQKANDAEKGNLRLEVEKLRRGEGEWLQAVVRMLDHTYALHTAAARSGKGGLVEQLTQFQNAQRDAARRLGLAPFVANAGDAFDAAKHQTAEAIKPEDGATVRETVATGYTFRGQQVRPALVALMGPAEEEKPASLAAGKAREPQMAEEQTLL